MLGLKKPQNAGKTVLAVGPNLVKLFLMVISKLSGYAASRQKSQVCCAA
jgi:hypothetical protein